MCNTPPGGNISHSLKPFGFVLTFSLPVASAYVPLGAAKSMLLLEIGLDWYWPIIVGILVFAGALEYLLVSFIVTAMPLTAVIIASLLVNFRHLFYALSYPMHRHSGPGRKLYASFALTDEAYLLTSLGKGKELASRDLMRLHMLLHFWWVLGSMLGVGLFYVLPVTLRGFEFGLTAMFTILAIDSMRSLRHRRYLCYAIAAILIAFISENWYPESFIIVGLSSLVLILSIDYLITRPQQETPSVHG